MSLTCTQGGLSTRAPRPWVITVIVIVVMTCQPIGELVEAYADTLAVATVLLASWVQQRRTATTATASARYRLIGTP